MLHYDAILFDVDGTLIDSDPYWVRSQETLVRSCGGEWSDALADALVFTRDYFAPKFGG